MTRRNLILFYVTLFLAVALAVGLIAAFLPPNFLTSKGNAFVFGMLSSIFVGLVTGTAGYLSNKYLDRAIVKLEHVDFKAERMPFKLTPGLWWLLTHSGFVKFVDDRVSWSVSCFAKNDFSYYHLQDIKDLAEECVQAYQATSDWTEKLIENVRTYKNIQTPELRLQLNEDFMPDIVRFEEHYREVKKSSLVNDLECDPVNACNFLEAEAYGLLVKHKRELQAYKDIVEWTKESLKKGENTPREIDHNAKTVPRVSCLVGVSNVGRTPALIRFEAVLHMKNEQIPLRMTSKYNFYGKIDPNEATPLQFAVDQAKCSFDTNKKLFTELTDKNSKVVVSLTLNFADGNTVTKKGIALKDNPFLQV